MTAIDNNKSNMKPRSTSELIKATIKSWLKSVLLAWLVPSVIFYVLSGNLTVFLAYGIISISACTISIYGNYLNEKKKGVEN